MDCLKYIFRFRRLAIFAAALLALGGCAILNRDNTPTYNLVEKHLWPDDPGKRVLAFPAVFPVGFAAITADAFVVHPLTVIGDAARDTKEDIWNNFNLSWDDEYVTECAKLPWRTAGTPFFFGGDFLVRSMFDITSSAEKARNREKHARALDAYLAALRQNLALIESGQNDKALDQLLALKDDGIIGTEAAYHYGLRPMLIDIAAQRSGRLDQFGKLNSPPYMSIRNAHWGAPGDVDPGTLTANERQSVELYHKASGMLGESFKQMKASAAADIRWRAYRCEMAFMPEERTAEILAQALKDPNPIVRFLSIRYAAGANPKLTALVSVVAAARDQEADPIVRARMDEIIEAAKAGNKEYTWRD